MLFSSILDDEVFLANEAQRQEYILNQEGIVYWGTENAVLAQPWDFNQVRGPICLSSLTATSRGRVSISCTYRTQFIPMLWLWWKSLFSAPTVFL